MKRRRIHLWALPSMQQTKALILVGGCCGIGILAGCLCTLWMGEKETEALRSYIDGFLSLESNRGIAIRVVNELWAVFRLPILITLLRFTVLGVVLIPCVLGAKGFLFSFAISAFVKSYRWRGEAAAGLLFGMPTLIELTCLMVLAVDSWVVSHRKGSSGSVYEGNRGEGKKLVLLCGLILIVEAVLQVLLSGSVAWILRNLLR